MSDSKARRALKRLLGPGKPELTCDECFEHLDRFTELELTGGRGEATVPGMTAHLAGCPACEEDYRSLRALLETDAASDDA
jgi:hypothetical protein